MTRILAIALLAVLATAAYAADDYPSGKRTVGFVQEFSSDFIHAGQAGIKGRARVHVNGPMQREFGYTNPVDYVQFAHMKVRWRIGDVVQADRRGREEWDDYYMVKIGPDMLETYDNIRIPPFECDLEFRFILVNNAPYYKYVDFTGLNIGTPGYSEEGPLIITNCLSRHIPGTRRTDWFQRVRGSASGSLSVRRVTP